MINANELRIGNFFIEEKTQTIIEVIGLEKNRVVFSGKFLNEWQAKPIPLTEDWLIRLGFYYRPCGISGADMWQGLGFWSPNKKSNIPPTFLLRGERNGFVRLAGFIDSRIEYVHQLQNLYQCLTGKELEVAK